RAQTDGPTSHHLESWPTCVSQEVTHEGSLVYRTDQGACPGDRLGHRLSLRRLGVAPGAAFPDKFPGLLPVPGGESGDVDSGFGERGVDVVAQVFALTGLVSSHAGTRGQE